MSNPDKNWGPQDEPTDFCRYLAKDGKYYNGVCDPANPDYDPFKETIEKVCERLKQELELDKSEK